MILQIAIVAVILIYFLSWAVGCVDTITFGRYLRKHHPSLASVHAPGVFKTSIHQQLKSIAWLWKRKYVDVGDADLTKRADMHRRINFLAFAIMVISMIVLFIGGPKVFSEVSNTPKEAEQAGTGQPATRPESDFQGSDKPQPESEGRSR